MATNFEFYKDEILRIARNGYVPILTKHGKVRGCGNTDCKYCAFSSQEKQCREVHFEWLYAEHIEQPKLTRRERAFCEAAQTGWIARDIGGGIRWFSCEPIKDERKKMWSTSGRSCFSSGILQMWVEFDFIHWEDEKPWAVEDLLKLEVRKDA